MCSCWDLDLSGQPVGSRDRGKALRDTVGSAQWNGMKWSGENEEYWGMRRVPESVVGRAPLAYRHVPQRYRFSLVGKLNLQLKIVLRFHSGDSMYFTTLVAEACMTQLHRKIGWVSSMGPKRQENGKRKKRSTRDLKFGGCGRFRVAWSLAFHHELSQCPSVVRGVYRARFLLF